jgi:tRNA(Arg) A34 adenosine deaminase TadA
VTRRKTSRSTPPGLVGNWDRPLSAFVTLDPSPIDDGLRERHSLYSLLVLALLASQWNGNKYGNPGDYGKWRRTQLMPGFPPEMGFFEGGTYLGHNIVAIAVDARGNIVDFDFNHNEIFNSSVEHAESRLLRRLFSLSQIADSLASTRRDVGAASDSPVPMYEWQPLVFAVSAPPARYPTGRPADTWALKTPAKRIPYSRLLTDVTVYTSLESCAQCSGTMTLADVREVVYLQPDQGQYLVGNMMFKATRTMGYGPRAPEPIPADVFGFPYYGELSTAYQTFAKGVRRVPFFQDAAGSRADASLTSFLCTDLAFDVVRNAEGHLSTISSLKFPSYVRLDRDGNSVAGALTNEHVLERVRSFLRYVQVQGGRGTAHRA